MAATTRRKMRAEAAKEAATRLNAKRAAVGALPGWPAGKAWPAFASDAQEEAFLHSWDFGAYYRAEPPEGDRPKARPSRTRVYRVRLTDDEFGSLQAAADAQHGGTVSDVIRQLAHELAKLTVQTKGPKRSKTVPAPRKPKSRSTRAGKRE